MLPCLHLILPGLLWPHPVFHDIAADLDLPALSWLLGRARIDLHHAPSTERTPEQVLCAALGVNILPLPYAALRWLGEDLGNPDDAVWLCADPLHLNVEQRRLTLAEDAPLASDAELYEIIEALSPLFVEEGTLIAGKEGRAYLRLSKQSTLPDLQTTPPSVASNLNAMLPQGNDALRWRKLINEAQMLLHTLPCNERREQQGLPRLNALWLWGEGRLPTKQPFPSSHSSPPRLNPPIRLIGSGTFLKGLAQFIETPLEAMPSAPAELGWWSLSKKHAPIHTFLILDTLQATAHSYDALQWREALLTLENDWFAPLRAHLTTGHLKHLRITAMGHETVADINIHHHDRWRFWCRPRALYTLHTLYPPSSSSTTP